MSDLSPCPFCGSKDLAIVDGYQSFVQCQTCNVEGPADVFSDKAFDGIEAWNRRASGWIAVGGRLPDQDTPVLAWFSGIAMTSQWRKMPWSDESWVTAGTTRYGRPSHWQPLPSPPEEKS